jgi:hypothetical protein
MVKTRYVTSHGKRIAVMDLDTNVTTLRWLNGKNKRRFAMVPLVWIDTLAETKANIYAHQLAMRLLYLAWCKRQTTVEVAHIVVPHMSRRARCVALNQLQAAGLITIIRHACRPAVVILHVDEWFVG